MCVGFSKACSDCKLCGGGYLLIKASFVIMGWLKELERALWLCLSAPDDGKACAHHAGAGAYAAMRTGCHFAQSKQATNPVRRKWYQMFDEVVDPHRHMAFKL